ncbi:glycosyl hydrolase 115 family protein [Brevundimonas albigilva]|uniref:Glycosyl hydrolase 115 family protein n=1 Tax=Brevundimonas albigilva TaxID=1312364 RepID=A0ABY4SL25_9CAUL|nr:glycosyl hydrolase 115 family protein [Brevundimonas albigilva]URI15635.1 glycosyl hydrolase 115 family protein [Brevundimonas albigilva]
MRRSRLSVAVAAAALVLCAGAPAVACQGLVAVCEQASADGASLIVGGRPARVLTDPGDWPGVIRAAHDLQADLGRVSGGGAPAEDGPVVLVGTAGRNAVIDRLIAEGRLPAPTGWDGFVQAVVERPMDGVARALVIAGADKRGTIYGAYDISERAGVSPWAWWADVPVAVRRDLSLTPGRRADAPAVRYRGVFLNDEEPALGDWVRQTFGGFNHAFYEKVFELILRLKGNVLWPAMWGKAFYDDDPLNAVMADEYGVVIGTSHHEPLARAHVEWERYGEGTWDWRTNREVLSRFWRDGVRRRGTTESLVTIGMRGDGDEAMSEDTAIPLLEDIVRSQRRIIEAVTGRPAAETPQVWALYKEVQDYYDQGMRVPDDVTLLFADDNWGNIRRLPAPGDRAGGSGVYYHFDYVGGPRNYKWLNTTQNERTWEQMRLAWQAGADRLWVVNVGDLKPMEVPIDFFLDQAWDPQGMTVERMAGWSRDWARAQFGEAQADEIAELIDLYTRYNSRRKPELIGPDTFSLVNHGEADRIEAEWAELAARADRVRASLPAEYDDAFVQLVWFPIQASGNVTALHIETGRNRLYAAQGRWQAAQAAAEAVRARFARDVELEAIYHGLKGGKWDHMMSQTHISYDDWQQPERDVLPELATARAERGARLGVAVEGRAEAVAAGAGARLPELSPYSAARWIEVFDRGDRPADFRIEAGAPWLRLSRTEGRAGETTRIAVSADWAAVPAGRHEVPVTVTGPDGAVVVTAVVTRPAEPPAAGRFVESDGAVAVEAVDYTRAIGGPGVDWQAAPGLGRTGSAVTTASSDAVGLTPGGDGPRLEYDIHLTEAGEAEVQLWLSPTLDFRGRDGLRYAVSIDDGPAQVVTLDLLAAGAGENADWDRAVSDNLARTVSRHRVATPGPHTVKVWLVDSGLVFQRLVVATKPLPDSYMGPPNSARAD